MGHFQQSVRHSHQRRDLFRGLRLGRHHEGRLRGPGRLPGRRRRLLRGSPRVREAAPRPQGVHQRRSLQELDQLGHDELLGEYV